MWLNYKCEKPHCFPQRAHKQFWKSALDGQARTKITDLKYYNVSGKQPLVWSDWSAGFKEGREKEHDRRWRERQATTITLLLTTITFFCQALSKYYKVVHNYTERLSNLCNTTHGLLTIKLEFDSGVRWCENFNFIISKSSGQQALNRHLLCMRHS